VFCFFVLWLCLFFFCMFFLFLFVVGFFFVFYFFFCFFLFCFFLSVVFLRQGRLPVVRCRFPLPQLRGGWANRSPGASAALGGRLIGFPFLEAGARSIALRRGEIIAAQIPSSDAQTPFLEMRIDQLGNRFSPSSRMARDRLVENAPRRSIESVR